jgi:hypothetical protein
LMQAVEASLGLALRHRAKEENTVYAQPWSRWPA